MFAWGELAGSCQELWEGAAYGPLVGTGRSSLGHPTVAEHISVSLMVLQ